jgi:hypothetical protein
MLEEPYRRCVRAYSLAMLMFHTLPPAGVPFAAGATQNAGRWEKLSINTSYLK